MSLVPDGFVHFLIGVPSYLENNTFYSIKTDIGYFRLIWGFGIIGLVLYIAFYCHTFIRLMPNTRTWSLEFQTFNMFIITIFILNGKEIFLMTHISFQIFLVAFFGLLYGQTTSQNETFVRKNQYM
jgi:hypothetical protein